LGRPNYHKNFKNVKSKSGINRRESGGKRCLAAATVLGADKDKINLSDAIISTGDFLDVSDEKPSLPMSKPDRYTKCGGVVSLSPKIG